METLSKLPEFYSPLCMILAGIASLAFLKVLRWSLTRAQVPDSDRNWVESALARFEARGRISWVLILFGIVWTLQLGVQEALAR
jgi:hypothetical protein